MTVYKYFCANCGEIEKTTVYRGKRFICGKCRRSKVLMDADRLTSLSQLE